MTTGSILVAFGVSAAVDVLFGIYPAHQPRAAPLRAGCKRSLGGVWLRTGRTFPAAAPDLGRRAGVP